MDQLFNLTRTRAPANVTPANVTPANVTFPDLSTAAAAVVNETAYEVLNTTRASQTTNALSHGSLHTLRRLFKVTLVPTPAIVFMAVIGGVILVLMILYQCLKAGMFFKTEPPADRPDEKDYAELGEAYGTETDDDYLGPSSKPTSRRSSFNTSGSKSDVDLALGDSASVYNRYSDGEYSPSGGGGRALSAYGDLRGGADGEFLSTAGRLQISASYAPTAQKLAVTIVRAEDIPTKQRGGAATVQVRVVILPSRRQRFKTKAKSSSNPNFHESFTFNRVTSSETHECSLRFRLYGHERISRDKLIGELNIGLTELDLDGEGTSIWRTLTPRNALSSSDSMYNLSDTGSDYGSALSLPMAQSSQPELLVSLCYQSLTGRLTVEVLKASNLRNVAMQRAPDTYVKVAMFNSIGQQLSKSKTSIRRSMYDPEFNETFVFQIIEFELPSVSLMFYIVNIKKMRRKEIIGWFSTGRDNTGEDEERHWKEMIDSKGKAVKRWHLLNAVDY